MRILTLFLLVSCSHSIIVRTPTSRFLSAEAQGESLKGNILLFMSQGTDAEVDLRNGRVDNSLVLQRHSSSILDPIINGEVGVWGPVDIVHISGGRLGSDMTGVKLQLLGDRRTKSKKNNTSVSLIAGGGSVVNNVEDGDDFELIPLDDDTTSELEITTNTVGFLLGHRTSDSILVNLGYHKVSHSFSGVLTSQNASLNNEKLKYKGQTSLTTLGFFSYSNKVVFGLEFTSENLKWDRSNATHNVFTNLAVGFQW